MEREKQIEELRQIVCHGYRDKECEYCNLTGFCMRVEIMSDHIYNEGYRKQSEVASEIFEKISKLCSLHLGWNEPRIVAQIDFDGLRKIKDEYTKGGEG